jgi:hypothetical protein
MMKILYIGDIHGDLKAVQEIRYTYGPDYRKVFIGDLVDTHEKTSYQDQEECVTTVLDMILKDKDTDCLIGNHELSYLLPNLYRCSGYNRIMETLLMPHISDIWANFKFFMYDEVAKLLVTHAGLTQPMWKEYGFTLENVNQMLTEWTASPFQKPFFDIGHARGGGSVVGGPEWCDFNQEFFPVEGLTQIFGHTPDLKWDQFVTDGGVRQKGNNYNIDCIHSRKILLNEDGVFREIRIGDK